MQPHRQQPTRLPRPWDSPGKNTGVGCHFLLQCMKVKSENEVAQSCPTLSNPMDCSPPASSIHGNFQARALEWVAIAFSKMVATSLDYKCLQYQFMCKKRCEGPYIKKCSIKPNILISKQFQGLHGMFHVLTITHFDEYYYSHFTDENVEAWRGM